MVNSGQQKTMETIATQNSAERSRNNPSFEEIIADSQKDQDYLKMEQKTKAESEVLADSVNWNKKTDSKDISLEQKNLVNDIDILLENYKKLASWIESTEWNRKTKRTLTHWLNENIKNLQKIKDDLAWYKYKTTLSKYGARVAELTYYFEHYEQVRQIIVLWWRTSDIHAIIDSKQDAKYAKKQERQEAKYQSNMNDILHDAALTSLWNNDMERYEEYLEAVLNWQVEPSSHPFYTKHMQSFAMIKSTSPDLYWVLVPNRKWQIKYDVYCQQNWIPCGNWYNPSRKYRTWNVWEDIIHTIQDIRWKEVTPQQREAWRKIWDLWSIVWCVALGVGIIRAIFPWKDDKWNRIKTNRWRVLWLWAGIYWITHYKQIKNMALDALNLDPDNYVARKRAEKAKEEAQANMWLSQSEAQDLVDAKIKYPTLVATTIGAIPIKILTERKVLEEKNGKLTFNKNNYVTCIESLAVVYWRSESKKNKILDKIALDDAAEAISNWLNYCWVETLDDLNKLKWSSDKTTLMNSATFRTRYEAQIDGIKRTTWIFSHMEEQWFVTIWLEQTLEILENYDSNKNENEQILQRLKSWLLKMDPEKKKPYDVANLLKSPYIDLMDLDKMTMNWFKNWANEIKFSSYWELFETVYITEWIKTNFKWRTDAKSTTPFHFNTAWQLEFDNAEWYELHKNEIAVIWLTKIRHMPTVTKNKQFYADYLNKRRSTTIPSI